MDLYAKLVGLPAKIRLPAQNVCGDFVYAVFCRFPASTRQFLPIIWKDCVYFYLLVPLNDGFCLFCRQTLHAYSQPHD